MKMLITFLKTTDFCINTIANKGEKFIGILMLNEKHGKTKKFSIKICVRDSDTNILSRRKWEAENI